MDVRKLNVADWLSVSRIILIPFLVAFIFMDKKFITGLLLLIGFITDVLDGYLARKMNIASDRGAKLDSLGDLLLMLTGLLGFLWIYIDFVEDHIWPFLITILLFTIQFTLSRIRYGTSSSFHTYLAKLTAVVLSVMLVASFFLGVSTWLYYLAFTVAIVDAIEEILLVLVLPEQKSNVKGLYWVLKGDV